MPYETKSFELHGVVLPGEKKYYSLPDFDIPAIEIEYEKEFTAGIVEKRLIEHVKTIFRNNDLKNTMPEGELDSLGIGYESYQLAFTPGLLDSIYKSGNNVSKVDTAMLQRGKYIDMHNDGNWWIRSGTVQFINPLTETSTDSAQRFYSPLSYTDPFGSATTVSYYSNYFFLLEQTKDELDNAITVDRFDFRTLSPVRMKDMNGNVTETSIDILGLVAGTAIMGKGNEGDDLDGFVPDLTKEQIDHFMADPSLHAGELLKHATARMIYDYSRTPCVVATIVREAHHNNNANPKLQYSFEYSDGLGNVTLAKVQAEPGETNLTRWVGNGRTILNNKGKPVKQYEPYFSGTHLYEDEPDFRETGVTPVLHYDAAGRLVKTELPDDTFTEVVYDAWKQSSYDQNDTVTRSKWYKDRVNDLLDIQFTAEGKDPVKEKERW